MRWIKAETLTNLRQSLQCNCPVFRHLFYRGGAETTRTTADDAYRTNGLRRGGRGQAGTGADAHWERIGTSTARAASAAPRRHGRRFTRERADWALRGSEGLRGEKRVSMHQ
eukprot:6176720-Pleurochrysis_carterae.AAC.3